MAENRSVFKRENDLLKESELYLQGKTQIQIAEIIGVSQVTISNDLKKLQKRWKEKAIQLIDERKAEELAKVDQLERTYWEAWIKSCDYRVMETDVRGRKVRVLVPNNQRTPLGDTKYLAGIQWCIDRRCKMLGVDAPQKIEETLLREYVVEFK